MRTKKRYRGIKEWSEKGTWANILKSRRMEVGWVFYKNVEFSQDSGRSTKDNPAVEA